ncbi:hypothetical protein AAC387_Pa08g1481 [Persea americana]
MTCYIMGFTNNRSLTLSYSWFLESNTYFRFTKAMMTGECRNCKACRPTQLSHECHGFCSTASFGAPSRPTFSATSTPISGPLNIWISNNSPGLEIKFELQGCTMLHFNFPQASTLSGTTTCRDTTPSPFGSSSSGACTTCRTVIPCPFGRTPCEATTFSAPFGRAPVNTTFGTTYQSQFGSMPCQTSTSCEMKSPTGATITVIVGSLPCTTCTRSSSNFNNLQVGACTASPAEVSHLNQEPQTQCTGSKRVPYSPTIEFDGGQGGVVNLQSISCIPAYKNKSTEELRWEDYQLGHNGQPECGSKPTGGSSSAPSTQSWLFAPPTTSSFGTVFSSSTSSAFHTSSSDLFSMKTTPSTYRSPFTSGVSSTASLFGPPRTTASSFISTDFGSMPSAQSSINLFSSSSTTSVFGKPQMSGTHLGLRFGHSGSSTSSVPTFSSTSSFGWPISRQSFPSPFYPYSGSSSTSVFGKPQLFGNVSQCISETPPAPAFESGWCVASTSSLPSFRTSSFSSPISIPSVPSSLYPLSTSSTPSVFGKPQTSGTDAPCVFETPPAPTCGTSCYTALPSSVPAFSTSSISSPVSIPYIPPFLSPFSTSITPSVFGKRRTSGTNAPCVFETPPAPTLGTSCYTTLTSTVPAFSTSSFGSPMAMPSFPSPIDTSSDAGTEMSETIVPHTFTFPAFGTNCSISAVHAFSGPSFYSTVKSEAMSAFCFGQPTSSFQLSLRKHQQLQQIPGFMMYQIPRAASSNSELHLFWFELVIGLAEVRGVFY